MQDFAPTTRRKTVKGYRTKGAARRHRLRVERHEGRQKQAAERREKMDRARSKRLEQGWWPPVRDGE